MSLGKRSLWASVSISGRTVFFLLVSYQVYFGGTSEEAVDFFQILFLQSVLTTFLSASGYFRMLGIHQASNATSKVSGHILFSILGCVFAPCVYFIIGPSNQDTSIFFLLGMGAGMASISGSLSGYILGSGKVKGAFMPSIISAFVFTFVTIFVESADRYFYFLLIVAYQTLTALLMILTNSGLLSPLISLTRSELLLGFLGHVKANLLFGSINTFGLFLLFFFREEWAQRVDPSFAAIAFYLIRISDIGLQLVTTVFAGHRWLKQLPKWVNFKTVTAILIASTFNLYLVIQIVAYLEVGDGTHYFGIFALQVLVDVIRYPLSALFLYKVSAGRPTYYGWYVFLPVSTIYILSNLFAWQDETYGIYMFMALTSILALLVFLVQTQIDQRQLQGRG